MWILAFGGKVKETSIGWVFERRDAWRKKGSRDGEKERSIDGSTNVFSGMEVSQNSHNLPWQHCYCPTRLNRSLPCDKRPSITYDRANAFSCITCSLTHVLSRSLACSIRLQSCWNFSPSVLWRFLVESGWKAWRSFVPDMAGNLQLHSPPVREGRELSQWPSNLSYRKGGPACPVYHCTYQYGCQDQELIENSQLT